MTGVPVCIVTTVVKILGKVHVESMFMFLLLLLLTEAVQPVFSTTARPATPDAGLHEEGGRMDTMGRRTCGPSRG